MLLAQLSDLHIRPEGRKAYGVVETNRMLREAVSTLCRLPRRPDAVIATGDLTDCGLIEEYEILKDILRPLDSPVYLVPGNHDRRENLRQVFGDAGYLPADGEFLHYVVDDHALRLIALDTVVPGKAHGEICARRRTWLAERLAEKPDAPTVIFMHHPPFRAGIQHMDAINCRDGDELRPIVERHRNVVRVLCGHAHRPIQALWAGTLASVGPSTAHQVMLDLAPHDDARFVLEPPAFQLHLWEAGTGLVSHLYMVGDYAGPYPFALDPDYPAFADTAGGGVPAPAATMREARS